MDYKAFFEKAIDRYLLHDLANMSEIYHKPGQDAGALGYAMLGTICSGMELMGAILRPQKYRSSGHSERCFRHYYRTYLAKYDTRYEPFETLFWQFIRNGIAHTYVLTPSISVTKQGADHHLKLWESGGKERFNIDCLQLYEDFRASYDDLVKTFLDKASDDELKQVQENIDTLIADEDVMKHVFKNGSPEKIGGLPVPPSGTNLPRVGKIDSAYRSQITNDAMFAANASVMTQEQAEQLKSRRPRDPLDDDFDPDLDQWVS